MKGKKSLLSAILALTIASSVGFGTVTQSACTDVNNNSQNEQTESTYYNLILNLNGGVLLEGQNTIQFESNKRFILPTPTKSGYKFMGWFDNEQCEGGAYSQIDKSDANSDKEFWAKWEVAEQTYNVTLHLNGGNFKAGFSNITSYTQGTSVTLPEVEKTGYTFDGWYESVNFTGSPVIEIPANATGNKEYYAKWSKIDGKNPDIKPVKYIVTFDYNYDGAPTPTQKEVESGKTVAKPSIDPTRTGYDFVGWFENMNGTSEYNFTSGVTKSFTLYAHWQVQTYKVTLNFNGGTIVNGTDVSSYTYGESITLPVLEKSGYSFEGWYESSTFSGSKVTEISATDTGDKAYFAKWTAVEANSLNVTALGGYEEGAYIEVDRIKGTAVSDYVVSYKPSSSGVADYKKIDAELVRAIDGIVRADIVGLTAGTYDIKVTAKGFTVEETVHVSAYDRSGYAHFKYTKGVGAYDDNGALKSNAIVVYVTEETKNTVQATLNGSKYTGIVNILANASKLNGIPLVVRIIGTITAATWNEIKYNKGSSSELSIDKVIGANGKRLPTPGLDPNSSSYGYIKQDEIISGGYNSLNESNGCTELKNLTNRINYDVKNVEYDSYYNMCDINGASNVTVEGIGTDAKIFQWGFTWKNCNSIEVRNLTFEDYPEDACAFEGNQKATSIGDFGYYNIWVHHNTFLEGKNYWDVCPEQDKLEGDGATDIKGCANVTYSYNHYFENHKTGLVGSGSTSMSANITFHHNWYEKCSARLPLARQANMHMYNNLYDGTTGTNMSLRDNAYAFIENCYFRNANNPVTTSGGYAKVYNCRFEGKTISSSEKNIAQVSSRTEQVSSTNIFGQNFDTNPNLFYYDSTEGKSDIKPKHGRDEVLTVVPELSGVHKN